MSSSDLPAPSIRRTTTVAALLVGSLLSALDVTLVGTVMPKIVGDLRGLELYGWVFSTYLLASTAMVPIYGKLADLIGRRTVYLIGVTIFMLGSLLCALAPSMEMLIVARAVQGLGGGGLFPVTMTIVGDLYAVAERSRVQGLLTLAWGVSSVLGPVVGGLFVDHSTWRWGFGINLPIGLVSTILLIFSYREAPPKRRSARALDLAGSLLIAATLVVLLCALGRLPLDPRLLGIGLVLLVAVVMVERRVAEPVVPPDLLRDVVVSISCVTNTLLGAVLFAFIAYVPLYMQGVMGVPPVRAGLYSAPISLTWTAAAFLVSRYILAAGYRQVLRTGAALIMAATCSTWASTTPTFSIPLRMVLFELGQLGLGGGMGLCTSALMICVQDQVPWHRRGSATATLQLTRQVGATLGTALLGAILFLILTKRLAAVPNAPPPETLVDPKRWEALSPDVLVPARAALSAALRYVSLVVLGLACATGLTSLTFPDVRAKTTVPTNPLSPEPEVMPSGVGAE